MPRSKVHAAPSVMPSWPLVALGEVASTQYGLSEPVSSAGSTPIVGMAQIQRGTVLLRHLPRVSISKVVEATYALREGDLLFNRTNSAELVGKCGIVAPTNGQRIVFASYLVRIAVDRSRVMPEFLNYVLNSSLGIARLRRLSTPGVSQYNINPTILLSRFILPLPPLYAQGTIVAAVRAIEDRLETVRVLRDAQRQLKRGLMQKLFAERRRVPGFDDEWDEYQLGDLFGERKESGRGELPLLSITADRGVVPRDDLERRDSSNPDKALYLRIAPGDIGYNTMRMWQGVSARSSLEGIVSPAYTICVPNERIDGEFAAELFKYPPVVHLFKRFSQGLVKDTLSLKFHHFAQIRVRIPPVEEQRAIAAIVRGIDEELRLLEKLADALDRQKRALLDKLLSGELHLTPK